MAKLSGDIDVSGVQTSAHSGPTVRRCAARLPIAIALFPLIVVACSDEAKVTGQTPPAPTPTKPPPSEPPAPGTTSAANHTASGTIAGNPFESEGWADDDVDTGGTTTEAAGSAGDGTDEARAPVAYDGPCYVRWNGGPILRFKYADDGKGGWLRIDGNNDGKSDVCARFWTKDKQTHKVTIDQGCDRSTDAVITPTPDDKFNLATATYTAPQHKADPPHEITLITLPAFTGVAPGYPLYGARKDLQLKTTQGRITQATVRNPIEGDPIRVKLQYNADGQVKRIDEDHQVDGKVDRRFDYRYDEVGNVTGITLTETTRNDGKTTKSSKKAKLGYSCWNTPSKGSVPQ